MAFAPSEQARSPNSDPHYTRKGRIVGLVAAHVSICPTALARSNGLVKRRFVQFGLRGLLGFAVVVCLLLGGWNLLETYGNRLDVEDARVGQPMPVKATYFRLFGPPECYLEVGYDTQDGSELSDGTLGMSEFHTVKRSWMCLYSIETELEPVDRPCQLVVEFERYEKPWGHQTGTKVRKLQEKVIDVKLPPKLTFWASRRLSGQTRPF